MPHGVKWWQRGPKGNCLPSPSKSLQSGRGKFTPSLLHRLVMGLARRVGRLGDALLGCHVPFQKNRAGSPTSTSREDADAHSAALTLDRLSLGFWVQEQSKKSFPMRCSCNNTQLSEGHLQRRAMNLPSCHAFGEHLEIVLLSLSGIFKWTHFFGI